MGDSDEEMPSLTSGSSEEEESVEERGDGSMPDLTSSDESSSEEENYNKPSPPTRKTAEPQKDFRSEFKFKFPATAKPAAPTAKQAPKGKIAEIGVDEEDSDDSGPPALVDDTDEEEEEEEKGEEDDDDVPPELTGASDSDSDSSQEPSSQQGPNFNSEQQKDYLKYQEKLAKERAEKKQAQREKDRAEEARREAKRQLQKEERMRQKQERAELAKNQKIAERAEIKPVLYHPINERSPEANKEEEDPSAKSVDHECFLKTCQWKLIKANEALVLLKCNDGKNHCRLYFHKSCWKGFSNTVLGKGAFGEEVTPPCLTVGCNGSITKIVVMMNGKTVEAIPLISTAPAPVEQSWRKRGWRNRLDDEPPTPSTPASSAAAAASTTTPPPVANPPPVKKAPAKEKEKEPGARLVLPYDPMAAGAARGKQNTKKEKEKEKETQETLARLKVQEARKQARIEELIRQRENASIPSLDQAPENGEWIGAGLNPEEEETEIDKLRKDLEQIKIAKAKEQKAKKKKKKKEKQKLVDGVQELIKEHEKKKMEEVWKTEEEKQAAEEAEESQKEITEEGFQQERWEQILQKHLSADSDPWVPSPTTSIHLETVSKEQFMSTEGPTHSFTPTVDFFHASQLVPPRQLNPNASDFIATSPPNTNTNTNTTTNTNTNTPFMSTVPPANIKPFINTYNPDAPAFKPAQKRSPSASPNSPVDAPSSTLQRSQPLTPPSPQTIIPPVPFMPPVLPQTQAIPQHILQALPLDAQLQLQHWQLQQQQQQLLLQQMHLQVLAQQQNLGVPIPVMAPMMPGLPVLPVMPGLPGMPGMPAVSQAQMLHLAQVQAENEALRQQLQALNQPGQPNSSNLPPNP